MLPAITRALNCGDMNGVLDGVMTITAYLEAIRASMSGNRASRPGSSFLIVACWRYLRWFVFRYFSQDRTQYICDQASLYKCPSTIWLSLDRFIFSILRCTHKGEFYMNEIQEIYTKFSSWICFANRDKISKELLSPGVYIVAENTLKPPSPLRPSESDMLFYVGETCDQLLRKRLYQFHRSAFSGKPAHSGGTRFHSEFRTRTGRTLQEDTLMIAVLPIANYMQKSQWSAYIRFAERAIIWNHVRKFNSAPMFNTK